MIKDYLNTKNCRIILALRERLSCQQRNSAEHSRSAHEATRSPSNAHFAIATRVVFRCLYNAKHAQRSTSDHFSQALRCTSYFILLPANLKHKFHEGKAQMLHALTSQWRENARNARIWRIASAATKGQAFVPFPSAALNAWSNGTTGSYAAGRISAGNETRPGIGVTHSQPCTPYSGGKTYSQSISIDRIGRHKQDALSEVCSSRTARSPFQYDMKILAVPAQSSGRGVTKEEGEVVREGKGEKGWLRREGGRIWRAVKALDCSTPSTCSICSGIIASRETGLLSIGCSCCLAPDSWNGRSVTDAVAKSATVNTWRSTGHSPVYLKPFIAVSIEAALGNPALTKERRNARAGETVDPRENPLTSGIVRHDSHFRRLNRVFWILDLTSDWVCCDVENNILVPLASEKLFSGEWLGNDIVLTASQLKIHQGISAQQFERLFLANIPTTAIRVQSLAGSLQISHVGIVTDNAIVRGFSRGSSVCPASSFQRYSILTSITLIGCQDLDVKTPILQLRTSTIAHLLWLLGASVAERVACSPPTKANQVHYPAGSLPFFRIRASCLTIHCYIWVALNIEVLRADEGEVRRVRNIASVQGQGEAGNP
ncbi:hypothetical protein PR048_018109 [Dryococelus australis]|uniref:Uncharacterized protein n=1 Tax=Dryococelus australis TaxID=614101 RepID=A0ABQ9HBC7_9NEOP|nr:hypothetical protein PR048_018109 [Dryococelus australis]